MNQDSGRHQPERRVLRSAKAADVAIDELKKASVVAE
jgi:hypothetical protein